MLQSTISSIQMAEIRVLNKFYPVVQKELVTRTSTMSHSTHSKQIPVAREMKFPSPYGYIAAKVWGNETGYPVLALHGWQDNAGTFDRLIPLLLPSLYIVAIDAPGHGLSSQKPANTIYHQMEYIIDIQRLANHLKWEHFSILGHSYGGILGYIYSSLYPDRVQNAIMLDVIKPVSRNFDQLQRKTKNGVESILELELKADNSVPVYSYENARKRLIEGTFDKITNEAADTLLKRGSKKSDCGTGFVFTRDIRIRVTNELNTFSHEDLKAYMRNLRCNLMVLTGKDSPMNFRPQNERQEFFEIYKQNCKSFKHVEVQGNHFVHLNNPENVASHINDFFTKHMQPSKL